MQAGRERHTHSEGVLFTVFGLVGVAGLLLAAARVGLVIMTAPLAMILMVAAVSWAWSRWSLKGVACERGLSTSRVFPGEGIYLNLRLINRKPLPVSWLSVRTAIPAGLELVKPSEAAPLVSPATATVIEHSTAIPAYASASWDQHVVCRHRGYYPLGPMAVASGDAFGLYSRAVVVESGDAVIVYPRILSLEELGLPARSLLGDTRAQLRLFEDPSRTMGVREYVPGDGLRRVHWKATARQGRLQVRVHEQTTTHKVGLFLSADDFAGLTDDDFELAISVMASVARSLVYRGGQVGLWVNAKGADNGRPARLPAAGGQEQLVQVLEALAKVTRSSNGDFASFFAAQRADLSFGTTPVFILGRAGSAVRSILADLRDSGVQPVVAQVGEGQPGAGCPGWCGTRCGGRPWVTPTAGRRIGGWRDRPRGARRRRGCVHGCSRRRPRMRGYRRWWGRNRGCRRSRALRLPRIGRRRIGRNRRCREGGLGCGCCHVRTGCSDGFVDGDPCSWASPCWSARHVGSNGVDVCSGDPLDCR